MEGIACVYARLIDKGMKKIEDVPEAIREEVEKLISKNKNY